MAFFPPPSSSNTDLSRNRLPEQRPHTVHSTSSGTGQPAQYASVSEERSDEQITPRASVAGPPHMRLSRDDTAANVSMPYEGWYMAHDGKRQPSLTDRDAFLSTMRTDEDDYPPLPSGNALASQQNKSSRSLGRKLSRKYSEKFSQITDGFTKHAPIPNRMRRSSTPHTADTHVPATNEPSLLRGPVSPSKRNASSRSGDSRARKLRNTFALPLSLGDRKDTPAPPTFGVQAARQLQRPVTAAAGHTFQVPLPVGGGENARKAAAMHNNPYTLAQLAEDDPWARRAEEDLVVRRGRLGSLNNGAADSGADLGFYDEHSPDAVDSAGEMDMDDDFVSVPERMDPVQSLPYEIALQIFEYLDAPSLTHAQRVCRDWSALTEESSVWRTAFLRKYGRQIHTDPAPIQVGGAGAGRPNRPNQEWKKMYLARQELEANWRRGQQYAGKAIYLSGHTDSVYCVQFDEEKIITGSRDRTIRVWDINTYQCLRVIGGPNVRPQAGPKVLRTVDYPSFHLATASANGTTFGNSIYHTPADWHDASILCLQYDTEILVTGSSDSDLIVWDIKTYTPIKRLRRHTGGVLDVALDGKHIISCSKDSKIIVWDRATYEPKGELHGHRGPVNAVQLRGKYLVSASGDGIARLWDIEQMKLIKEFNAKERGLAAVEFSEDMKHVLAGGNDHITYKFEVETGREVKQFTGHTQLVRSLWLDSANNRVVSGSYDLDLRVYDFETGQQLWRAEEWTTSWMLAAKSDYRRIVATSQDGRILVVDFGLRKGGLEDGTPIDYLDELRGQDETTAIRFTNPWTGLKCR